MARADRRMRSFQQQDKGLKANSTGKVVKPVRIMTGYEQSHRKPGVQILKEQGT